MSRLRDRVLHALPAGRLLPEAVWQRRHRAIVRLALGMAVALVLFSWVRGFGQPAAVAVLAAVAGPAGVAAIPHLAASSRSVAATT